MDVIILGKKDDRIVNQENLIKFILNLIIRKNISIIFIKPGTHKNICNEKTTPNNLCDYFFAY